LIGLGYGVPVVATTGGEALQAVETLVPDLVLMDVTLNGPLDGIQTAERIHEEHGVPIVYLTAHSDETTLARAKETGPYGFLVKPSSDRELRASIEIALGRHGLESKAAEKAARLGEANLELMARSEDRKRESERLLAAARTDPLTEAANRLHLQEDLEGIADRVRRYGHHYGAAFCDIDALKSYNDSFGHLAGDLAIRLVSHRIRAELRRGDGFYRYGGDEFLVLLPEQTVSSARECMQRVCEAVGSIPVAADGGVLARGVTISVGIADFCKSSSQDEIQSWLTRADAALYRAKAKGRNRVETDP
jgi:two-component system chemotaxis response regulator CheY